MPILQDEAAVKSAPRLYQGIYPSVTETLSVIYKPHLENWRKKVGNKVADKISTSATTLGTKVHAVCHRIAIGEELATDDPKILAMGQAYQDFLDEYVDEIMFTEREIVSPVLGIGGTVDAYVRLHGGKYAILDIKTSKGFDPEMGLQMAGYMLMLEELGYPVDARIIVRLNKERPGRHHVKFYELHDVDKRAFIAARDLWYWRYRWHPPEA